MCVELNLITSIINKNILICCHFFRILRILIGLSGDTALNIFVSYNIYDKSVTFKNRYFKCIFILFFKYSVSFSFLLNYLWLDLQKLPRVLAGGIQMGSLPHNDPHLCDFLKNICQCVRNV